MSGGGREGGGACQRLARSITYTCYVYGDFESNIVGDVFWVNFACLNFKNTVMKLYVMTIIAINALLRMILRYVLCSV